MSNKLPQFVRPRIWFFLACTILSGDLVAVHVGAEGVALSRMGINEHFQADDESEAIRGFRVYGGRWRIDGGVLHAPAGPGPKLVAEGISLARGEVGVEVFFPDASPGNAGLIVKLSDPGVGADHFNGYEVALDAAAGHLRLARHRQNYEPIRDVPYTVPVNRWISLVVRMTETTLEIVVDGTTLLLYEDDEHPLTAGGVAFRPWQREARFRNFWLASGDERTAVAFEPADDRAQVCQPWTLVRRGSAEGQFGIVAGPTSKHHGQQITFVRGDGQIGIQHSGTGQQGIAWRADHGYRGWFWARCDEPAQLLLTAAAADGQTLATTRRSVAPGDWQTVPFTLTPQRGDDTGRLLVALDAPGTVVLARAVLQPSDWAWPETLATGDLPPIAIVLRHPLSAPPAVGQDLAAAQPRAPGCSIRIIDAVHPEQSRTVFHDPDGCIYDMNVSCDARTLFFSYRAKDQRTGISGGSTPMAAD
jgi:hypothetical protein